MQGVAFISLIVNGAFSISKDQYELSQSEMFTYSEDTNTLVFLIDHLDYDYIDMVLEDDLYFFDNLDGFTSYKNAISEHMLTIPGANHILTNVPKIYNLGFSNWLDLSWEQDNKNILKDLKKGGYELNLYTSRGVMFGENIPEDLVSNLIRVEKKINNKSVIKDLISLSIYRYTPVVFKPFFWLADGGVGRDSFLPTEGFQVYTEDETIFAEGLDNIVLTDEKQFKFYHFMGSHAPYTLLENGERSKEVTDVVQQTKGSFNILFQAFDKMKQLDIYKDTAIIIVADHGNPLEWTLPLQKETRIGLFYKPKGSEKTPLQYSKAPVSHLNIPATILKSANISYENYGQSLDEIGEDDKNLRYFYKPVYYDANIENPSWNEHWDIYKEDRLLTYEIKGDASNIDNWTLVKNEKLDSKRLR